MCAHKQRNLKCGGRMCSLSSTRNSVVGRFSCEQPNTNTRPTEGEEAEQALNYRGSPVEAPRLEASTRVRGMADICSSAASPVDATEGKPRIPCLMREPRSAAHRLSLPWLGLA